MLTTLGNAKAGLSAQMQRMEVTGNNIANITTTGFKRQSTGFTELLRQQMNARGIPVVENNTSPPFTQGSGIKTATTTRRFDQGNLTWTGRNLDLAINGSGFFRVTREDGETLYTRDGSFHVGASGKIIDGRGNTLLPQALPQNYSELVIDAAGQVSCRDEQGNLITVGQIELAVFPNQAGLSAVGENLFRPSDASGAPQNLPPGQQVSTVKQGYLEESNVDLTIEMQSLIEAQRSFQLNAKSINTADQLWNLTNSLQK